MKEKERSAAWVSSRLFWTSHGSVKIFYHMSQDIASSAAHTLPTNSFALAVVFTHLPLLCRSQSYVPMRTHSIRYVWKAARTTSPIAIKPDT